MNEAIPERWTQLRDLPSRPEMSVFPDREPRIRHEDVRNDTHRLTCPNCKYNLTGSTGRHCPECGLETAYEPVEVFSAGELSLVWAAAMVLDQERISNLIVPGNPDPVAGLVTDRRSMSQVMVPLKFYYEAVDVLDRRFGKRVFKAGERPQQPSPGPDWQCPSCDESNPAAFELCWQCASPRAESGEA